MFTGIVEAKGRVRSLEGGRLTIDPARPLGPDPIQLGESIAVNGCCLTVVAYENGLEFDLSPETLARTSLGTASAGAHVNLERAMRADGRFGGHVVQGHVDATATMTAIIPSGNSTIFRFRVPEGGGRYLIDKGSITLDGVSLTVVRPEKDDFEVWVIPHTLQETNLGERQVGDRLNVEYDVLAKYVERLVASRVSP